jgi:hypothetical protein
MKMTRNQIIGVVLAAWVILALLSLIGARVPAPAEWLWGWTKWISTVIGIVVSARVLWSGAEALRGLGAKWSR